MKNLHERCPLNTRIISVLKNVRCNVALDNFGRQSFRNFYVSSVEMISNVSIARLWSIVDGKIVDGKIVDGKNSRSFENLLTFYHRLYSKNGQWIRC